MEQAVVQVAIQVPTVALTLLFAGWVIRFVVTEIMVPRLDKLITLMEEHNRKHR